MQQLIKNLNEKIKVLSQPNPKIWPDPFINQLIWNQNIANIYANLAFFIFFATVSVICNFTLPIKLLILGTILLQLCASFILCRSYLWICNIFFAISSLILITLVLEILPDAVYYYMGFVLIFFATLMRKTRDVKITLVAGIAQAFLFYTRFKEKLIIVLESQDPEIFADNLIYTTLACYLVLLLVTIVLFKALDQCTLEMYKSKRALENALEQQKIFIFSFSHELRNPINSLLGNLQLVLQGEALSTKAAEMINVAKVCGEILMHNINNVLDTGKHEIGKLEVNPVSTRLHELFRRTWSIYSELLRQKKLKSQLKIEKDLPAMVKIDSHKVNQMMLNLIGNAVKFTDKGSVTVTVKWLKNQEINEKCFQPVPYDDTDEGLFEKEENLSTISTSSDVKFLSGTGQSRSHIEHRNQQQEESKGVLKIIVKDTGSGMKEEALEKLFQKFSQVSENLSQRQIGTGLGLFITKEICLAMGGEIRAYSKIGIGSTFIICLPTTSVPLTQARRVDPESIMSYLKQRNLRVLVADDSPFNVNLTCNYFSQFGASVVSVAYNGYDAYMKYKELANSQIDVVTLDIDMPVMDGRAACDKIRQYEKENRLRPALILLISGNYDREQIDEYIDPGRGHQADFFLKKPVSFLEFVQTVYNLVTPPPH